MLLANDLLFCAVQIVTCMMLILIHQYHGPLGLAALALPYYGKLTYYAHIVYDIGQPTCTGIPWNSEAKAVSEFTLNNHSILNPSQPKVALLHPAAEEMPISRRKNLLQPDLITRPTKPSSCTIPDTS